MLFNVIPTDEFLKHTKKLVKKFPSLKSELQKLTTSLAEEPMQGTPLGNHRYKIRLAVKSKGKGKSGGMRVITYLITEKQQVFLIDIYDKSENDTIADQEIGKIIQRTEIKLKNE
jgi:mRNA-degrading endonuclease RelE of RelBE toxin-antitoxin system